MYDYLEDPKKYFGLSYKEGGKVKSVSTELKKAIDTLLGKTVREYTYSDIFANELCGRAKYNPKTKLSAISKFDFTEILNIKLADLNEKIKSTSSSAIKKELTDVKKSIDKFLNKKIKSGKDWQDII